MRVKEVLIATVVAVAVFAYGKSHAATRVEAQPADISAAVDSVVEQRMRDGGLVGLGAAIIVDNEVVWMKGYGFADRERAIAFTPDTVMNIASISKTFTGAALMRAVQEGKVSLDEDINAYLPFEVINPHFPKERITLRQLATHTSSISDRPEVYEATYHFGGAVPEDLGTFLKGYLTPDGHHYSEDNFLRSKPGSQRDYSNIGAGLAGYIIELAVGEKLNAYTKRHIFAPLGMSSTGWFLSEIPPANHATLYVSQGLRIPIPLYEGTTYPDGGVRTSVSDLGKFFIALLNEGSYKGARILEKPSAREMLRFQFTSASKPENVNIQGEDSVNSGIFWGTKYDTTRIGHNGSDPGVRTMMLADPDREFGVILFTNTSTHDEESEPYSDIFDALWAQAARIGRERRP
jgi:CubicO group peptidase (beta-lactamase class C family)